MPWQCPCIVQWAPTASFPSFWDSTASFLDSQAPFLVSCALAIFLFSFEGGLGYFVSISTHCSMKVRVPHASRHDEEEIDLPLTRATFARRLFAFHSFPFSVPTGRFWALLFSNPLSSHRISETVQHWTTRCLDQIEDPWSTWSMGISHMRWYQHGVGERVGERVNEWRMVVMKTCYFSWHWYHFAETAHGFFGAHFDRPT